MNIIIIGATSVGLELAEYLVNGGHAVTLVDNQSEELNQVANRLDLRVVQGVPSWPSVLRNAGAENTELLVATSPIDEMNIAACSIAASLFRIPRKIARIRSPDYLLEADEIFGNHAIPIDHVISPEHLISQYIIELLTIPGACAIGSFADDRIVIISARVGRGGKLIGKEYLFIKEYESKVKILAVYRKKQLLVNFEKELILSGDTVFFCCERNKAASIISAFSLIEQSGKCIAIAGGTHTADEIAKKLSTRYRVKLIEPDAQRALRLSNKLKDTSVEIYNSDSADLDFLIEEHIGEADRFIAASPSDETNIITAFMLRRMGKVKTIAVIRNARFQEITTGVGREIDIVVSPKEATISAILSQIRQEGVEKMRLFRQGLSEGIELHVQGSKLSSKVIGKRAGDINLPTGVTLGLALRNKVVHVIDDNFKFEDGDRVVAYLHDHNQMRSLVELFRPHSFWIRKW